MKAEQIIGKLGRIVFLVFIIAISTVPLLWTLVSSFKTNKEIMDSAFSLPASINLDNYIMAFKYSPLGTYFWNTFIITVFCIFFGLIIFSMSAYVFARFEFKGKNFLFALIGMSMLVPTSALIFPVYKLMNAMNLYNTKSGLVLVYMAIAMPSVLFVLRSYFLTIPKEMEEAARIDGSGFMRTYITIMLPLVKPAMATAAILIFMASWNDFIYNLMLSSGNNARNVSVALSQFLSMFGSDYGQLFAASFIVVLPSILLYCLLQKRIESALLAGAVKG
ncbi:carbohydrate ABC transporter permease [Muricomes sp. OA1]|uniref:Carbohydrate ABC transporter permease n=1 Tax=Hungatella hathewayi TaxID=154046 RepID=A0A3E2WRH5_9FIRM|nr:MULTISPECIES: carbohydrate ABC transporter permease [Clostridia]MCH1971875.1 carbohydrate ABC transporter permease [Muricomes sp. OA1]MRM89752.1 carbohydrate ABC transporter permease [Faecalicatena contorta]RGC29345.1 carbohydrate ABC transporter permease [Hungatella hathewayi]GKH30674.1 putative ABC transporter permease protein YurM [Faecalicatena contorta]